MLGIQNLPLAFAPERDELLSSWLVRLAYAHHTKVYTFCKALLPTVSIWNRDIDKSASPAVLAALTKRTGVPLRALRKTVLQRYEGRLYEHHNPYGNTDWLLPLGVYHRTRRRYGLLFCPGCLRLDGADPYFRTQWRLALSIVCPACRVYLQDRCPRCQQPVIFFRQELGRKSAMPDTPLSNCFHCGFDLSQAPLVAAPACYVDAQRERNRILREGWMPTVFYPHLYFSVVRKLARTALTPGNSRAAFRAALFGNVPPVLSTQQPLGNSFEQASLEARGYALQQVYGLLQDWPTRFVAYMKHHHIASTPLLSDMQNVPFWYASVVQEQLYVSNTNRHLGAG